MRYLKSLLTTGCLAFATVQAAELHKDVAVQGTLDLSSITNKSTVRADLASNDAGNLTLGTLADARLGANVILATGSYSNPAWLALTWSKLTATPTSLAGYGIADAQPLNSALTMLGSNTAGTLSCNLVTASFAGLASTPLNASNVSSGTLGSARLPANLTALADNSTTSLTLGHITIGSLAALTADRATVTVASGTAPYFTARDTVGGTTGELGVVCAGGYNSLFAWNTSAGGFSAYTTRSAAGKEHMAMGEAGSTAGGSGFTLYHNNAYIEVTDANGEGWTPSLIINQHTTYNGSHALGGNARIILSSLTGELAILPRFVGTNLSESDALAMATFTFDPDASIVTGTGTGTIEIRGGDANCAMVFRELPAGRCNHSFGYGGTLAQGGGFEISTGGVRGSQVVRVTVADEQTNITNALSLAPMASAPSSPAEGWIYANSSDHHLYFYNGSAWKQLDN